MLLPTPISLELQQQSRLLTIAFDNGEQFALPCEYLRVYSPSAEVRGHGKAILQTGKKYVTILNIEPVGHYAVKLIFDDGHASGIYSWDTLYNLAIHYQENWQHYLHKLMTANASREP